jgi:type IV pilus assembly protein PilO
VNSAVAIKKTPLAIKLAIIVAGLVVLAGAGYFLLVQPKKAEATSLKREIAQDTSKVNENKAQAQRAAGLSKILVADYYKLTTAMPDDRDMPDLILQLNAIARDTGISFDAIAPGTVIDSGTYQVIPVSLTFQGTFIDLSDFLLRLRSLVLVENGKLVARGRLFTVDQITFSEGGDGFPSIRALIQMDAYIFGHPVSVAAPVTGGTETSTTSTSTTSTTTTPSASGSLSATGGGGS